MDPATNGWTLRVDDLVKTFKNVRANDGLTLEVRPGEVYGLLGPNGAGKSTLVKQVIGLLKPTAGTITLGPYDLVDDPDVARQLCSYLPQAPMPIDSFKAREAVTITGMIRGGPADQVRTRGLELLNQLELSEWTETLGANLSGGVRRLVGFVMATVWPGPLVILDEPTNDVDPLRRRLLWDQVRALGASGVGVILVTHNVLEAEKAVDRLAIINEGRIIAEGTPSSMKADDRGRLRLQLMLVPGQIPPTLPDWVEVQAEVGHTLVTVINEDAASDGIELARRLMAAGTIEEYALAATTLEDVYIRLTGHRSENES